MLCLRLPLLLLLVFLLRSLLETAGAESSFHLPAPQNVIIVSNNFQSTLKWSPVKGINNSEVSYRVEYCSISFCPLQENSINTTKPEYYFTNDIRAHVKVIFRVRTEQGELKSDWVETPPFRATDKTILGPPREIDTAVEGNSILVSYKPPFDNNSTFFVFRYVIYYWKKLTNKDQPSEDKVQVVETSNTRHKLANLMEKTEYCIQIESVLPKQDLHGNLSYIYCKKTSLTEATKILTITLVALSFVVLFIFFFLMITLKHSNIIKSLCHPPLKIPLHYQEDLQNPRMGVDEEFKNSGGEEHWDSVSVISNVEQNPTVTNNTDCNNQEVDLL
ncbi:interferon gamma receptor 2 [Sphaerodactylus townsendi]|uniref:interferon gamma receptor 2 n=1 Tax=Sphaerodactylus townsendi TaxID=933632 RepID=UPI002026A751|nr:interferon gamma receptor 2 [Sphaerodactylus townsendi]